MRRLRNPLISELRLALVFEGIFMNRWDLYWSDCRRNWQINRLSLCHLQLRIRVSPGLILVVHVLPHAMCVLNNMNHVLINERNTNRVKLALRVARKEMIEEKLAEVARIEADEIQTLVLVLVHIIHIVIIVTEVPVEVTAVLPDIIGTKLRSLDIVFVGSLNITS